ncbi:hypothetical protein [Delftia acidovorans]|uniref:hypothetical protein n=1 Tax=Delftia acidovorans TaxID=80866 RepID=UPI0028B03095|nr:hypothetical protein [Delftia acidovorans]
MAVQPAAKLSPVPEFPSLARRATGEYNGMAYSFGSHMGGDGVFVPEINALSDNVQHNAQEAVDAAGASASAVLATEAARDDAAESAGAADGFSRAAAASAGASAESAGAAADSDIAAAAQARLADDARRAAQDARDDTEGLRDEAEDARDAAQAYRNQAEVFATQQLVGHSTTSVTPGAGNKTFMIEAARSFVPGMYLVATSQSSGSIQMSGAVQAYNSVTGSLTLTVDAFAGSTAKSDWVIGVAARSANGALVQQVITTNTTAVPGVLYVIAGANVTLTLPTTGLSNDSRIEFVLAAPVSRSQIIDFGTIKYRGIDAGQRYIDKPAWGMSIQHNTTTGEWV